MKITILKENLKRGLNIVEKIAGKNLTLPILNNVLISTDKNFLNFSTTDLEIGINYWALAKIEEEGKIAVSAKFVSNLVSSLPDEKIEIKTKNNVLFIECENYKAQIKGFDPEEFPIIPEIKTQDFIELDSSILCNGISQVLDFCASTQIRPELSGIYFQIQKDKIKLASTDSFRLAEKIIYYKELETNPLFKDKSKEYCFIVPQKIARDLSNIISDKFTAKESKIKIYFSPNQVLFELPIAGSFNGIKPELKFISRLIEGEFPNYNEIIPKKFETQAVINRNDFLGQIKTASLFSGKVNEVKIKVSPKKGILDIFSQNSELGENKSSIVGKIEGEDVEVAFNYKFLIDGLLNIKSNEVILELNKEDGPVVLKPVGDDSYIYVVMPIKAS